MSIPQTDICIENKLKINSSKNPEKLGHFHKEQNFINFLDIGRNCKKSNRRQRFYGKIRLSVPLAEITRSIHILYEKIDAIFKFASILIFRLRLFDVVYRYFMFLYI